MKLASLNNGTRDGALCVVSRNLKLATVAYDVAPTLQAALDDWDYVAPLLGELYEEANRKPSGSRWFELDPAQLAAPLPRAYAWISAAAYPAHLEQVRAASGLSMPDDSRKEPWLTQGRGDGLLGPTAEIVLDDEALQLDLEAGLAVVTGDVPRGIKRERAGEHIRLVLLANEFVARASLSGELTKGSGPFHSRIGLALSPVAVTPDELGAGWDGRRVQLTLEVKLNDEQLGAPHAATDMAFDFPALIAAAARHRALSAGTLLTAGAIANRDADAGACSLIGKAAVAAAQEDAGNALLRSGDRLHIEMRDSAQQSIFGAIAPTITGTATVPSDTTADDAQAHDADTESVPAE